MLIIISLLPIVNFLRLYWRSGDLESGQFAQMTPRLLRTPQNQASGLVIQQKPLVPVGAGGLSQAPEPTGAQCSREFQGWGRARVFLWVGKSGTPAMGSCSSWSPLEGTVRENSRRRKQQMEPLGSNSESRTVGPVCLLFPHWKDGALGTMARALSSGWGLREKGNLSTPGQGMRGA